MTSRDSHATGYTSCLPRTHGRLLRSYGSPWTGAEGFMGRDCRKGKSLLVMGY